MTKVEFYHKLNLPFATARQKCLFYNRKSQVLVGPSVLKVLVADGEGWEGQVLDGLRRERRPGRLLREGDEELSAEEEEDDGAAGGDGKLGQPQGGSLKISF